MCPPLSCSLSLSLLVVLNVDDNCASVMPIKNRFFYAWATLNQHPTNRPCWNRLRPLHHCFVPLFLFNLRLFLQFTNENPLKKPLNFKGTPSEFSWILLKMFWQISAHRRLLCASSRRLSPMPPGFCIPTGGGGGKCWKCLNGYFFQLNFFAAHDFSGKCLLNPMLWTPGATLQLSTSPELLFLVLVFLTYVWKSLLVCVWCVVPGVCVLEIVWVCFGEINESECLLIHLLITHRPPAYVHAPPGKKGSQPEIKML